jgi:hypothetical protein
LSEIPTLTHDARQRHTRSQISGTTRCPPDVPAAAPPRVRRSGSAPESGPAGEADGDRRPPIARRLARVCVLRDHFPNAMSSEKTAAGAKTVRRKQMKPERTELNSSATKAIRQSSVPVQEEQILRSKQDGAESARRKRP